jgi:hypothetical protein
MNLNPLIPGDWYQLTHTVVTSHKVLYLHLLIVMTKNTTKILKKYPQKIKGNTKNTENTIKYNKPLKILIIIHENNDM